MKKVLFVYLIYLILTHFSFSKNITDFLKEYECAVVIYDLKNNSYIIHNEKMAKKRFYPASTFKIFNSLIGLEYKIVKDVDEIFYYYDNSKVLLDSWKENSNLRYAIKVSQVPAYQLLARKIGIKNMQDSLNKLNYGNKKIENKLDSFWLNGPLKISPMEQVKLINLLSQKKLPFSIKNQEQVIDIMFIEKNNYYSLYGKTGTIIDKENFAWFVGFIKTTDNIYSFSSIFKIENKDILEKRKEIIKNIFEKFIFNYLN